MALDERMLSTAAREMERETFWERKMGEWSLRAGEEDRQERDHGGYEMRGGGGDMSMEGKTSGVGGCVRRVRLSMLSMRDDNTDNSTEGERCMGRGDWTKLYFKALSMSPKGTGLMGTACVCVTDAITPPSLCR